MCCLGVLEHVCGAHLYDYPAQDDDTQMPSNMKGGRRSPGEVLIQLVSGVRYDEHAGAKFDGDLETYLAHMNDNGKDFEEIADYIDKNL